MLIILKPDYIYSNKSTMWNYFPPAHFFRSSTILVNLIYFPQFPQLLLLLNKFIIRKYIIRKIESLKEKYLIAIIKKIVLVCK